MRFNRTGCCRPCCCCCCCCCCPPPPPPPPTKIVCCCFRVPVLGEYNNNFGGNFGGNFFNIKNCPLESKFYSQVFLYLLLKSLLLVYELKYKKYIKNFTKIMLFFMFLLQNCHIYC